MSAKARAKKTNKEFTIEVEDIIVPDVCPILGIPLTPGVGKQSWNSPTLDRKDNEKGYTKENISVISLRANMLKSDMTTKQVEKLYRYVFGLETK